MSENETQLTHEDALEALRNARKDAATQRTQKANALNRVEALSRALKAAGLDPDADDLDTRAAALADAGEALEQLDAVQELVGVLADTLRSAGIDPQAVAQRVLDLPDNASDDDYAAALRTFTDPLTAPQARLQQQERELAASRLGLSLEDLSDVLGERQPTRQTVQRDGQDVEVFGVGEGDSFKPLDEMRAVQALRSAEQRPEPQRQQFPAQATGGGKPAIKDPVQERIEARKAEAQSAPDPFRAPAQQTTNGGI